LTRNVGDTYEQSQVLWHATMKNSVSQHGDLVLYALGYQQPIKLMASNSELLAVHKVGSPVVFKTLFLSFHSFNDISVYSLQLKQHAVVMRSFYSAKNVAVYFC